MSDEEAQILHTDDGQMLTAEYRDGQLQIVEVTAFDKSNESHILPDMPPDETRYVQVFDGEKGIVHLDLLSLIKCSTSEGDNNGTYQVLGTSGEGDHTTVTCVLTEQPDVEDNENQDSYVVVNTEEGKEPLVYLQSSLQQIHTQQNVRHQEKHESQKQLSTEELLARAKLIQKARALNLHPQFKKTGRKRKSDLPPPVELLSSPSFKLYLYNCKLCNFKCNAMQEMSKHKATEHGTGKKTGGRQTLTQLQCAKCPFRATTYLQFMKHVNETHDAQEETTTVVSEDQKEKADYSESVEVLVCGACGFESQSRDVFQKHVETVHSVSFDDSMAVVTITEADE